MNNPSHTLSCALKGHVAIVLMLLLKALITVIFAMGSMGIFHQPLCMFPVLTAGSRWELWADVMADIAAAFRSLCDSPRPWEEKGWRWGGWREQETEEVRAGVCVGVMWPYSSRWWFSGAISGLAINSVVSLLCLCVCMCTCVHAPLSCWINYFPLQPQLDTICWNTKFLHKNDLEIRAVNTHMSFYSL